VLVAREAVQAADAPPWPALQTTLGDALTVPLLAEPWTIEIPLLLPPGRIALDDAGHRWWRSADGANTLPVAGDTAGLLCGTDLARTAAIWSGNRLMILAAQTMGTDRQ
jgi:hypothetical protein